MANQKQAGFTLIEIMLVLAISSSLAALAFVGQRDLRARAQFDGSVNHLASTLGAAQTESTAGARNAGFGSGTGTSSCPGSITADDFVFAGVAWTTTAAGPPELDYYKASNTASVACVFDTQPLVTSTPLLVNSANPPGSQGGREVYARRPNGALEVCPVPDLSTNIADYFLSGSCPGGTLSLDITDGEGHAAHVDVQDSGLAKRTQ